MATKIEILEVTEPTAVKMPDGSQRHWFKLVVAAKRGLRMTTASRNFWKENRDGIDREAAVAAMEAREDVGAGEEGLRLVSVNIDPRPVIINGEHAVDGNGRPVFQRSANLIVLPGETVEQALDATFRGATLRGTTAQDAAPSIEPAEDELVEAAL